MKKIGLSTCEVLKRSQNESVPPWEAVELFPEIRVSHGDCSSLNFVESSGVGFVYFIIDAQ